MIKAKPRQRRGRGGGAKPAGAAAAGGARQRYAGNAPAANNGTAKVNTKINQAAQKPLGGDAVKVIISNLPSDVSEAAVRVRLLSYVEVGQWGGADDVRT